MGHCLLAVVLCSIATTMGLFPLEAASASTILDADVRIGYKPASAVSMVFDRNPYDFTVSDFTDQVESALVETSLMGLLTVLEVCGVNPVDYTNKDVEELASIVCSERQGQPSSYSYVIVRFAFINSPLSMMFLDNAIAFANISSMIKSPKQMYTVQPYYYNSYQNAHPTAAESIIRAAEKNVVAAVIVIMFIVVAGVIATVGLCWWCCKKRAVKATELSASRRAAGAVGGGLDIYNTPSPSLSSRNVGLQSASQRETNVDVVAGDGAAATFSDNEQQNSSSVRSVRGGLRKPPPPPRPGTTTTTTATSSVREAAADFGSPIVTRGDVSELEPSSAGAFRDFDDNEEMRGFGEGEM